jgi:MOSC domain-containing protein YiiM
MDDQETITEAVVLAVCRSEQRVDPKVEVGHGQLQADWGLVGDSHAGPRQPGRWQISLLAWEDVANLNREQGLNAVPGSFAENLTTRGLDTSRLRPGDQLQVGALAILQVEHLGKPPGIAHTYSFAGHSLLPTVGVFCGVLVGGPVASGDRIVVLPKG